MSQVKAWAQAERHDGGRGVCSTLTRQHRHLALSVHAYGVVTGRERVHEVQVVALDPILQFAGCVARVGAQLEHGDHHHLHWNRMWFGSGDGCDGDQPQQASKSACANHH